MHQQVRIRTPYLTLSHTSNNEHTFTQYWPRQLSHQLTVSQTSLVVSDLCLLLTLDDDSCDLVLPLLLRKGEGRKWRPFFLSHKEQLRQMDGARNRNTVLLLAIWLLALNPSGMDYGDHSDQGRGHKVRRSGSSIICTKLHGGRVVNQFGQFDLLSLGESSCDCSA